MAKNDKALAVPLSKEQLAVLDASYPIEDSLNRILLPRLGLISQDVTEGKGRAMKVIEEAGTFFIERQSDEVDPETKKKLWKKTEIGTELDAIIVFERKQLRFYDSDNEEFVSSPIFDGKDQVIPLFKNKVEVARGTPAELQARKEFQGVSAAGKPISKLEENKILYVLYEEEMFQMNLRGTSMYAFKTYKREVQPNKVVTHLSSEAKEKGSIAWNQMTFEVVRDISGKEGQLVIKALTDIKDAIEAERAFYDNQVNVTQKDVEEAEKRRAEDKDF